MTTFTNQYQGFYIKNAPNDSDGIFEVSASTVRLAGTLNFIGTITTVSTAVTIASVPVQINGTTYYLLAAVTTGV